MYKSNIYIYKYQQYAMTMATAINITATTYIRQSNRTKKNSHTHENGINYNKNRIDNEKFFFSDFTWNN